MHDARAPNFLPGTLHPCSSIWDPKRSKMQVSVCAQVRKWPFLRVKTFGWKSPCIFTVELKFFPLVVSFLSWHASLILKRNFYVTGHSYCYSLGMVKMEAFDDSHLMHQTVKGGHTDHTGSIVFLMACILDLKKKFLCNWTLIKIVLYRRAIALDWWKWKRLTILILCTRLLGVVILITLVASFLSRHAPLILKRNFYAPMWDAQW